jgi:hypothetical protein
VPALSRLDRSVYHLHGSVSIPEGRPSIDRPQNRVDEQSITDGLLHKYTLHTPAKGQVRIKLALKFIWQGDLLRWLPRTHQDDLRARAPAG